MKSSGILDQFNHLPRYGANLIFLALTKIAMDVVLENPSEE